MEKQKTSFPEDWDVDEREYRCARKYEKIVTQFDEMLKLLDKIPMPRKRRKLTSNKKTKQPSSIPGSSNSASQQGDESSTSTSTSTSSSDQNVALKQIITRHLNELQQSDY